MAIQFQQLTRRDFLKMGGSLVAVSTLAACTPVAPAPPPSQPAVQAPTQAPAAVPPPAPTGAVTVMHFRHELTEDQEKQFEKDNPGISIEFMQAEQTAFFARYAAGTPPDLYRCQAPSIPQFLARKLLRDLTPYFEVSKVLSPADLAPANDYYKANSPLEIGKGRIYGMCKDFSPDFTVFANKALFTAAGLPTPDDTKALSYDEIFQFAKKLTKFEGDRLLQMGYAYEGGWMDRIWMNMLAEKGQSLYTSGFDKIVLKGNEEAKKVLRYYFDLAKERLTVSPRNPSPAGWFGNDFTAGTLALAQYGFWYSAMAESDKNRGNVLMLPGPSWSGKRRNPTMTATGMIMTSATKVADAAWKVFEWYNGGQPSIDRAKSGWGVPALKSQWPLIPQQSDFQRQANKVLQGELALNTPPIQFNPFLGETAVPDTWNKHLDVALKGDITFDDMVTNIEKEVNEIIKDGIDRIMR